YARRGRAGRALDGAGEAAAVGAVSSLAQEGLQVLADDAMEDGALRGPGPIGGDAHGRRASEKRAVPGSVPKTALRSWTARQRATGIRNTALRAESDRQHRRRKRRREGFVPRCAAGAGQGSAAPLAVHPLAGKPGARP